MLTLYIFVGILYQLLLLILHRLAQVPESVFFSEEKESVTIILPFRNEVTNLARCLESILKNGHQDLELLCVDDHSTDESCGVVRQFMQMFPHFKIRLLSNPGVGKKAAVTHAVQNSTSALIVTTDADCVVTPQWIECMAKSMHEDIQLVAGPVMSATSKGFFNGFQQLDWASIGLVTRVGIYTGNPLMCSAANMLYRKAAFEKVHGYQGNEHFLSGDDEFLLKKITAHFGSSAIAYQAHAKALVLTQAMPNWEALFQQRVRWASKWKAHGFSYHALAALFPVVVQLLFLFLFFLPLLVLDTWWLACLLLGMKVLVERFTLGSLLQSYGIYQPCYVWVLTSLVHPIYVVVVGVQTFFRKIEWKGRKSFR
jgi:poly-beta-1,6-N-acetyl-D-glucosamine synthase